MAAPIELSNYKIFDIDPFLHFSVRVSLGSRKQDQKRRRFISISEYQSNWYRDVGKLSGAYINLDAYLILESETPFDQRVEQQSDRKRIAFSYDNIHSLDQTFAVAYQWLTDESRNIFTKEGDNDVINKTLASIPHVSCESLHLKRMSEIVLTLTPTIRQNQFGNTIKAVLVYFGVNPPAQVCSLDTNQVASVLYFLQHFDLSTTALMTADLTISALPFLKQPGG
jgi:hypothetical protein